MVIPQQTRYPLMGQNFLDECCLRPIAIAENMEFFHGREYIISCRNTAIDYINLEASVIPYFKWKSNARNHQKNFDFKSL